MKRVIDKVMDEEDEDEEEDGPEDTDEYVDQSPNGRWFRRDQPVQAQGMWGLTASYLAIDMEEGKEVVWNEIEISQEMHSLIRQDNSKEAMEGILKIFKRIEHVNLITYSGYWIHDSADEDVIKIVYITEYTSAGTLRSFLRRSRINKKKIAARVWRRWCRQILRALDYLHSSAPSITHGHLNCDTIYIHHDGIIKVGSVAPNIIKDFLLSLKEGKDFDEKACYKTPNSKDIKDFGNCLLEVFATGVDDADMLKVALQFESEKVRRDLTEEERKRVRKSCGTSKDAFLRECFSENVTVDDLAKSTIFIEVPPLKVMSFYALQKYGLEATVIDNRTESKYRNQHVILVNNKQKKHEASPLDLEKLVADIESGMFPLCGIDLNSTTKVTPPTSEKVEEETPISKAEERLILTIKCHLNPSKSNDEDKANLSLEFQMTDRMIRKLDTEISIKEDSPSKLADELIHYNLLNTGDRQMVIESLEEVLSS